MHCRCERFTKKRKGADRRRRIEVDAGHATTLATKGFLASIMKHYEGSGNGDTRERERETDRERKIERMAWLVVRRKVRRVCDSRRVFVLKRIAEVRETETDSRKKRIA